MLGYLILLFTVVPAIELMLIIRVGQYIGAANTVMLIIITGVAGAYLARLQGFLILQRIQKSLNIGEMPTEEMLDGLMVFCGGIVLLTPGFITDAIGLLLLIPASRYLIKMWIRKSFSGALSSGERITIYRKSNRDSKHNDQDYEDADFY